MPALKYWDGTAWITLVGGGIPPSAEVNVSTAGPAPRVSELLWVDTDDTPPGTPGQRWSPEYVITSQAAIPAGSQSANDPILTHNLGASGLILGHVEDGSWSHQLGWRMALNTATQVSVTWWNPGPSTAQGVLRFRMLY